MPSIELPHCSRVYIQLASRCEEKLLSVASVPILFLLAEFTGGRVSAMLSNSIIAIGALLTGVASGQATSPPKYPSPWIDADFNWEDPSPVPTNGRTWAQAYDKAVQFVSQLTLLEKVNLTTGVGWEGGRCVGNTGSIPRLGFPGLCNQDSPLGVRDSKISPTQLAFLRTILR